MTLQYSVTLRNARLAAIQSTVGAAGVLKFFSGAEPANCAASDPSGPLGTIALPGTFITESGGVSTIDGNWSGTMAASGTIESWRIYDNTGTNCVVQGSTVDMTFDNAVVAVGQTVTVVAASITASNA